MHGFGTLFYFIGSSSFTANTDARGGGDIQFPLSEYNLNYAYAWAVTM